MCLISACNDCAETTYYNYPGPSDRVRSLIPYQNDESYVFANTEFPSVEYELNVISRIDFNYEHVLVEEHNTHLGIFCEKFDPETVFSAKYNQVNLGFRYAGKSSFSTKLSLMLGVDLHNFKEFFFIHNNTRSSISYNYETPNYQYLSSSEIGLGENTTLGYEQTGPITINSVEYDNLYRMDTIQLGEWKNGQYSAQVFFLSALYSPEHGFVRLVLPQNDTFDLRN